MGIEYKVIVLIFVGVLVLIFIVFFVIFKYCGEMKVFMFIYFNWYLFDCIDDFDLSKLYDVFVFYNSNDYCWVLNILWDRFENYDFFYILCVYDCDF